MDIFSSLEVYKEIRIGFGRKVKLRRFSLREVIEFEAQVKSIGIRKGARGHKSIPKLLIELAVYRRPFFLSFRDKLNILKEAHNFNFFKRGDKKSREPSDPLWLQGVIAYFGREFGWSKRETLSLYPQELEAIISKNESFKTNDRITDACIRHSPSKAIEHLLVSQEGNNTDISLDREKLDTLKNMQRQNGGKNGN